MFESRPLLFYAYQMKFFYNVMNEKTTAGLWCKLESLHDE